MFFHHTGCPISWYGAIVFVVFFVLAIIFGLWPILKASRMSPVKGTLTRNVPWFSLSNVKHKPLSKSGITWSIASRNLLRRQSATFRVVILLSIVFILLRFAIAGGIIANGTTTSWVQDSVGKNTIAIAASSMGKKYEQLLSRFSGSSSLSDFNYSSPNLAIPNSVITQLSALSKRQCS